MRYHRTRLAYALLGLVLAVGVGWLFHYAGALDRYYQPEDVSRWEHAGRWSGAREVVVVGFTVTAALAATCLVRAAVPRRLAFGLPPWLVLVTYSLAFGVAWYALTGGH